MHCELAEPEEKDMYWNIPLDVSTDDEVDQSESYTDVDSGKRYHGSSQFENDFPWLYYSHAQHGWMCKICEKYPYNAGPARSPFSVRPCVNTEQPTHSFKQHEKSGRHQRLEKKLYKSENELKEALQRAELSLVEKAKVNTLYVTECIHTIDYLIRKKIVVNTNYVDLIRFFATELQEPITKQYLNTSLKNATYTSTTAAESLLDAMNIYFEKLNMREIKEARLLCLYGDEAESSSHKVNFSLFLTYLSPVEVKA